MKEQSMERLFARLFAGDGGAAEEVRAIIGALEKILAPMFKA